MQEDLTIKEFEALVTERVHCLFLKRGGSIIESCPRNELALKYAIAANKIFGDFGFNDLEAIFRRARVYIIFKPTGRIACEVCIDGLYKGNFVRRSKALLMSRRGYVRNKTLRDLIDFTAKKGKTVYSNLTKEEIHAKRKALSQS